MTHKTRYTLRKLICEACTQHNRSIMRLVFGDLIITKGTRMITQELLTDYATLAILERALIRAANDVQSASFTFAVNSKPWREQQDRYEELLYAANDAGTKLTQIAIDLRQALAAEISSTEAMIATLVKYGIANPRPLNSPLDPGEPVIMSNERERVAIAALSTLQAN